MYPTMRTQGLTDVGTFVIGTRGDLWKSRPIWTLRRNVILIVLLTLGYKKCYSEAL